MKKNLSKKIAPIVAIVISLCISQGYGQTLKGVTSTGKEVDNTTVTATDKFVNEHGAIVSLPRITKNGKLLFTCGTTITDVDSNIYNTVQIGTQCWMKENLKTTKYADGTAISNGGSSHTSTSTAYYYYPNGNSSNKAVYGLLYNWAAVMKGASSSNTNPSGVQGICPDGWHVPSNAEWVQLTDYVKSQSEYLCNDNTTYIAKALAADTAWTTSSTTCHIGKTLSANNATGFSALPAGFRYYGSNSGFGGLTTMADFWSSTSSGSDAYRCFFKYNSQTVLCKSNEDVLYDQRYGFSVRCVQDVPLMDTLTFKSNGGSGTMEKQTIERGIAATINSNSFTHTGNWEFIGWNTAADGTGTPYDNKATLTTSGNITLYAQWHSYCTGVAGSNEAGNANQIDSLQDIDDNWYEVVTIGTQCWMKENLRTTRYTDSTSISRSSTASNTAYYYYPNGSSSNKAVYGLLYNWAAVMNGASSSNTNPSGVQGICPDGWHVPSNAEWVQLTDYVKSQSEYLCNSSANSIAKALASTTGWSNSTTQCAIGNDLSANNATGFSVQPAGYSYGSASVFNQMADLWSSTESSTDAAYRCYFTYTSSQVLSNPNQDVKYSKKYQFSVRCVRN